MVRGDVFEVKLRRRRGHVQHGRRYAVVVQADNLLALSTVVICPTSQSTLAASFRPEIQVAGESTKVMCEMAGVVDPSNLGGQVDHLSFDEIRAVEDALRLILELA